MKEIKKSYIHPAVFVESIYVCQLLAGSGPYSIPRNGINAANTEEAGQGVWFESKGFDLEKGPWKTLQ